MEIQERSNSMRKKEQDTYAKWKADDVLNQKLALMKEYSSQGCFECNIAKLLNIDLRTLTAMKKRHRDVVEALNQINLAAVKMNIKLYQIAYGYEIDRNVVLKDSNGKTTLKKIKEPIAPSLDAQKYWFQNYDKGLNPRREEIDIQLKRIELAKGDDYKKYED